MPDNNSVVIGEVYTPLVTNLCCILLLCCSSSRFSFCSDVYDVQVSVMVAKSRVLLFLFIRCIGLIIVNSIGWGGGS